MVAESEHEWNRAHLHDLGKDEPDGWGGLGMSDECRPSVLPGDGGDAVGGSCPLGAFDLFAICEYNTRHD